MDLLGSGGKCLVFLKNASYYHHLVAPNTHCKCPPFKSCLHIAIREEQKSLVSVGLDYPVIRCVCLNKVRGSLDVVKGSVSSKFSHQEKLADFARVIYEESNSVSTSQYLPHLSVTKTLRGEDVADRWNSAHGFHPSKKHL